MFAQHELALGDHADHTRRAMMAVAYDDPVADRARRQLPLRRQAPERDRVICETDPEANRARS
jgi:hypothetical protein